MRGERGDGHRLRARLDREHLKAHEITVAFDRWRFSGAMDFRRENSLTCPSLQHVEGQNPESSQKTEAFWSAMS